MNQIPAIINTNPPEPKALAAELTADMVVDSITPSNNYGKDQFEITAKIESVDQFYSKKYWVLQSMPGAKELTVGQIQPVALRRRRLQQTREGVIKKGYGDEGNLLRHEWDWEIVALDNDVVVNTPTPPASIPTPMDVPASIPIPASAIASAPTKAPTMATSDRIDRAVAFKIAARKSDKTLKELDQEELGLINTVTDEFVKILNNTFV